MFKLLKVGNKKLGNHKTEKKVDEKKKMDNIMRNLSLRSLKDKIWKITTTTKRRISKKIKIVTLMRTMKLKKYINMKEVNNG